MNPAGTTAFVIPTADAAERAVLGAILADSNCFQRVVDTVGPNDFYSEAHCAIFEAFVNLAGDGREIDLLTATDQLERSGKLAVAGGATYVSSLADGLPDPANVEHYAAIVREKAIRRDLLTGAQRLMVAAASDNGELAALRSRIETLAAVVDFSKLSSTRRLSHPEVEAEANRLRVRDAAARIVRLECAGALPEPSLASLADFLAVEDEVQRYRIDEIWPVGGRVILAAPYKAGKTTLRDNLLRSLADAEPFLGRFRVHPAPGCTVVFDNELSEGMCRRWLRKQEVASTERVMVVSLRGRLSTFDLLDQETRARWAGKLRAVGASVLVLDCLRAVLDALGLEETREAGRFLVALDSLLAEAGVPEALVVHHAGHGSERSRGDSRLRDWPDAEWRLVREKVDDEAEPQPDARRFFSAYGRDVDVPEGLLEYDKQTRRLRFAGGTRKETAADRLIPELVDYLVGEPGATGRQIEKALVPPNRRVQVRQAVRRAIELGQVKAERGERRAILHTASSISVRQCAASAPQNAGAVKSECASAPIGAHGALLTREETSAPSAHSNEREPEYPPEEPEVAV